MLFTNAAVKESEGDSLVEAMSKMEESNGSSVRPCTAVEKFVILSSHVDMYTSPRHVDTDIE